MSIKVMTLVWENFPGSGSDLLAMLALADWCNDQGGSLYPSVGGLAKKIRVSPSQSRRIVHQLIADGYLEVVGNHNGGAPGTTRQYRMIVEKLKALSPVADYTQGDHNERKAGQTASTSARGGTDARGSTHAQDGLHPCAQTASTHASQTVNRTVIKPSVCITDGDGYTTDFEEAFAAYPKRVGGNPKRAAFKAWNARIKAGDKPQDMLDGVLRYAAFCVATGKVGTQFVKQAASFFGPEKHYLDSWEIVGVRNSRQSPHELPQPGSYGQSTQVKFDGDMDGII